MRKRCQLINVDVDVDVDVHFVRNPEAWPLFPLPDYPFVWFRGQGVISFIFIGCFFIDLSISTIEKFA